MTDPKLGRARVLGLVCMVAACSAAATVIACGSFSSTPEPEPEPDAATLPESGPTVVDAAPGASPFCAAHADAALCADFDEGDPVGFHFISTTGSIDVSTLTFVSPTSAMRASTTSGPAFARGRATAPALAERQRLSFDTYQGTPGGDGGVTTNALLSSLLQEQLGCYFDIESFGTHARFNVAYPSDGGTGHENFDMSAYPPGGRWAHVTVLLESAAGQGVFATVTINDVVALPRTLTKCPALAADPFVHVGLANNRSGGLGDGEAHYDNVLFGAD
ncbi:MAG: hypothetical protein JWP87_2005 [Labilithrix sp.]|nr:hypothetical protein [Labilithrix sp.]